MRAAKSNRVEFFQRLSGWIDPGIVVRNVVALRKTLRPAKRTIALVIQGLAADRMAFRFVLIDVDSKNTAEETRVDFLSRIGRIVAAKFIASGDVQKSVCTEEHRTAQMVFAGVVLLNEHALG